jgi:hypothetical protein
MKMEMFDRLPTVFANVAQHAIPRKIDALTSGDFGAEQQQFGGEIGIAQFGEGRHVPTRDDQHVNRRFGVDVPESETPRGLSDKFGCEIATCDLAKDAGLFKRRAHRDPPLDRGTIETFVSFASTMARVCQNFPKSKLCAARSSR